MCWGVLAVFDSQFNDAFSLQQTRTGAHGKTSHLLHTGDEEIHPAQTAILNHVAMWKKSEKSLHTNLSKCASFYYEYHLHSFSNPDILYVETVDF